VDDEFYGGKGVEGRVCSEIWSNDEIMMQKIDET
jgi:hypothetical protein